MPRMAMGTRRRDRQPTMWVATTDLPTAASHPFCARLNRLLANQGFDDFAETACQSFYADKQGRPGLPPGIYFRLLFVGYFEGLDSERGIAWRAADSLHAARPSRLSSLWRKSPSLTSSQRRQFLS